jgi:hypothetical protein
VTFISIHSVIIYVVFFGACMRCTRLCPLNPKCYKSGIKGMLTVGRNLDRNRQNPYLLTLLWFFSKTYLNLFSSISALLWYSDYSYLILLKTNVDFTLWNPMPKVTFRNRRPTVRNKNKTIFIGIYTLECLSTITSTYTYRHKYK